MLGSNGVHCDFSQDMISCGAKGGGAPVLIKRICELQAIIRAVAGM